MKSLVRSVVVVGVLVGTSYACSGTVDLGGFEADGSVDAAPPADADQRPDAALGPTVEVRLTATQEKVGTMPGTSGQTPIAQTLAIRSLILYRDPNDTSPLVVFDVDRTGPNGVECSVADKADTSIATVPVAGLVAGKYDRARIGVAYATWSVVGRAHVSDLSIDGRYDTVQVLTKGATVNGQVRDQGYFKTTFTTPGQAPVSSEGTQLLPIPPQNGIVKFVQENGAAFYEFPVDITVDTGVVRNLASLFEVNTYENFRWIDRAGAGYADGVWDTEGAGFETVASFGVNSAKLSFVQK
jgi:hypothetical protein